MATFKGGTQAGKASQKRGWGAQENSPKAGKRVSRGVFPRGRTGEISHKGFWPTRGEILPPTKRPPGGYPKVSRKRPFLKNRGCLFSQAGYLLVFPRGGVSPTKRVFSKNVSRQRGVCPPLGGAIIHPRASDKK